jgi:molybdopterin-containing oxidoreductase family membrane subunit
VIAAAGALVVLGGLAQMYVTIVGGQAFPLELFPGFAESSTFFDGEAHRYVPTAPELALGLAGFAVAGILVALAVKLVAFLPERLSDKLAESA